jgi:hypothetical protein
VGMSRTTIARVFEIIAYKTHMEKTVGTLSAETLAKLYKDAETTQPHNFITVIDREVTVR